MSDIIIIRKAYSNKRHTALVLSALASPAFLDIFTPLLAAWKDKHNKA